MKKLLLLFFILSFSICEGQSWVWVKGSVNNTSNSVCDPTSIATDTLGNVYEIGVFSGSITFGSDTVASYAPYDVFLVKYDPNGNALWAKCGISGLTTCTGYSVTTDIMGNAYVSGSFSDTITFGSYTLRCSANYDVFLVKYDPNGNVLWAKSANLPSSASKGASLSVTTDNRGCAYITGRYWDTISFGPTTLTSSNYTGEFLAKYAPNGNVVWAKGNAASLNGYGQGYAVTSDNAGDIYVTGIFSDTISFGSDTLKSYHGSVFLVKYDTSGNVLWAENSNTTRSYDGGVGNSIATDNNGYIYITGQFWDTLSFGLYKLTTINQNGDVFIVKYDPRGNVVWAKCGIVPNTIVSMMGYSVSADKWGHIYVSGTYMDSISIGTVKLTSQSFSPAFLFMLDTSGAAICGASLDNYNDDWDPVAADPLGHNVYFSGDILSGYVGIFGQDTLRALFGLELGFFAKWTCDTNLETSVNPISNKNSITLFPNPSSGIFTIQSSGVSGQLSVEVYNVLGEKVYSSYYSLSTNHYSLDLSSQPNGIYLYRVLKEDGSLIGEGKMIVQR